MKMTIQILSVTVLGIFLFNSFSTSNVVATKKVSVEKVIEAKTTALASAKVNVALDTYSKIEAGKFELPTYESFAIGMEGYNKLKAQGKVENEVLTVVDFSLSSNQERMWIIDMKEHKIILQCLVSHGMNSGKEFAKYFSNQENSNKSSLGFYITGETYQGKHGLSLKIDGQEKGITKGSLL
jgi:hypothetical protein